MGKLKMNPKFHQRLNQKSMKDHPVRKYWLWLSVIAYSEQGDIIKLISSANIIIYLL